MKALRQGGVVGAAVFVSTGLGYLLLMLASRFLAPSDYATFLAAWGLLFGLGSALSVLEQESARLTSSRDVAGATATGETFRLVALGWAGLVVVWLVLTLTGWANGVTGSSLVTALVALASVGFVAQFTVRGTLTGLRQLVPFAGLVLAEALLRLVAFGSLWATHRLTLTSLVGAVAVGSFGFVVFLPRSGRSLLPHPGGLHWTALARRVVVLSAAAGLTACLITGYPAVLTLILGSNRGLAPLFAAITAARLPLVALAPIQAVAVPELVRHLSRHDGAALRRQLRRACALALAGAVLAAAVAWALGPLAVRLMFGPSYIVSGMTMAVLAGSTVIIGAALLSAAALVAADRHTSLVLLWGSAVGASVLTVLATPGFTVTARGALGLFTGSVTALGAAVVLLLAALRRPDGRATDAPNLPPDPARLPE